MKKKLSIEPLWDKLNDAKKTGVKHKDISKLLGVSPQYFSDMLHLQNRKGKKISIEFIVNLCGVFDCNIQDVVQVIDADGAKIE